MIHNSICPDRRGADCRWTRCDKCENPNPEHATKCPAGLMAEPRHSKRKGKKRAKQMGSVTLLCMFEYVCIVGFCNRPGPAFLFVFRVRFFTLVCKRPGLPGRWSY